MATELKDIRLYTVRTAPNVCHSGIEAKSANEAIELACKNSTDKTAYYAKCQKIYEASVGTETTGEAAESDNDVFEIKIRGTNPEAVDRVKELLAKYFDGPVVEFEYGIGDVRGIDAAKRKYNYFNDDLELTVVGL